MKKEMNLKGYPLYGSKTPIGVLQNAKKTNTLAPAGIGLSKFHSGTSAAKFSNAAICLDQLLIKKCVGNVMEIDGNGVYAEIHHDGKTFAVLTDVEGSSYYSPDGTPFPEDKEVLALMLYYFKNSERTPEMSEFADTFVTAASEFARSGHCEVATVAKFCDSFYYGIVQNLFEDLVIDDRLTPAHLERYKKNPATTFKPLAAFSSIVQPPAELLIIEKKEEETATKGKSVSSVINEAKEGKYFIDFEFEDLTNIPPVETLDSFVPSEAFIESLNKINFRIRRVLDRIASGRCGVDAIAKDYINIIYEGRPGTGKTTAAYALGAATHLPVYTVSCRKKMEDDAFEGGNTVVDGKIVFHSTPFLDGYKNGGIIVLEEINLADPAVIMGVLGQAIEFPFILHENGYKPVRRHPLCIIIGTMNVGTQGSRSVNEALGSRFKQKYLIDDPTRDEFISVLTSSTQCTKRLAEYVFNAYTAVIASLQKENADDYALNITLRSCLGAIENVMEGSDVKIAIKNSIINSITMVDLELGKKLYQDVILNLPDYKGK